MATSTSQPTDRAVSGRHRLSLRSRTLTSVYEFFDLIRSIAPGHGNASASAALPNDFLGFRDLLQYAATRQQHQRVAVGQPLTPAGRQAQLARVALRRASLNAVRPGDALVFRIVLEHSRRLQRSDAVEDEQPAIIETMTFLLRPPRPVCRPYNGASLDVEYGDGIHRAPVRFVLRRQADRNQHLSGFH